MLADCANPRLLQISGLSAWKRIRILYENASLKKEKSVHEINENTAQNDAGKTTGKIKIQKRKLSFAYLLFSCSFKDKYPQIDQNSSKKKTKG